MSDGTPEKWVCKCCRSTGAGLHHDLRGRFKDSGPLMYWAFNQGKSGAHTLYEKRDEAADIGTRIHELIESDVLGIPSELRPGFGPEMRKQAEMGFRSYLEWKAGVLFKVVRSEVSLVSESLQCGGTIDAVARVQDKLCLADWKSGKEFYLDQLIQLTFYADLWTEHHPKDELHGIHVIRFGKTGCNFTHTFFRSDDPKVETARQLFRLYRQAYDLDRELRK